MLLYYHETVVVQVVEIWISFVSRICELLDTPDETVSQKAGARRRLDAAVVDNKSRQFASLHKERYPFACKYCCTVVS
jgi:hypothetical protein